MPAENTTGSTVPRRQLGRQLRNLRNSAMMTVKVAAGVLEWSEPKLWRIETGQTSLRGLDVQAMCRVYGASPEMTEALMGLAKETKARGWWHAYGDVIPEWFDLYIGLEEAASDLAWYESDLVPGLLQAEDYARILIRAHNPGASDEEVERRLHVRIARQALVERLTVPLRLRVVLNEGILRRPVGGPRVMATQLDRLTEAAQLANIALRVVPNSVGFHPGLVSGQFEILRFPMNGGRESEPPTVYAEGFTGALYLDKPHEVARYDQAFAAIWDASLNEPASTALIHQAAKELRQ
jgi:hypothetical protein